jgi:hypothetical protein
MSIFLWALSEWSGDTLWQKNGGRLSMSMGSIILIPKRNAKFAEEPQIKPYKLTFKKIPILGIFLMKDSRYHTWYMEEEFFCSVFWSFDTILTQGMKGSGFCKFLNGCSAQYLWFGLRITTFVWTRIFFGKCIEYLWVELTWRNGGSIFLSRTTIIG